MSVRLLARMYLPNKRLFVHCIRRGSNGDQPEGVSRRYTAIVLIGLATELESDTIRACGGDSPREICGRILDDVGSVTNLGDVALTLWAARLWRHSNAQAALDRLRVLDPVRGAHDTVEIAWALTALSCSGEASGWPAGDAGLAKRVAGRLAALFHESSGAFQHVPSDASPSRTRAHVCCFADLVYPTQAFSYYGRMTGDKTALDLAKRGAEFM
ncbi:MAG: hypothetical protein HOP29_08915, partial [Phycisphaerales bacterium]|nr:hypothetical protein [Phycisphaerales bacterium]